VALRKRPWGRITAVLVVAMLTITAVALSVRQPNRPPIVSMAAADRETAIVPSAFVNFTGQATDPDGDAMTYSWDFGDGTVAAGVQVTHQYALPGWYIAVLTVTDGKGGVGTNDGNLIFVHVLAPVNDTALPAQPTMSSCPVSCLAALGLAVLAANRSTVATGSEVRFSANASWGFGWAWNNVTNASRGGRFSIESAAEQPSQFSLVYAWGDGSTNTSGMSSAIGETTHTFSSPGNYFVRLNVSAAASTRFAGYTVRVVAGTPSAQLRNPELFNSATPNGPESLDPAVDNESAGGEVLQNLYDTLIWYPPGLESVAPLSPRLAAEIPSTVNGGISPDGKNYTFHLRSDVRFHSNLTMTAESVNFTFHRLLAIHAANGPSQILGRILTNSVSAYPAADCNPALAGVQACTIGDWVNRTFPTRTAVPGYMLAKLPPEPGWDTTPLSISVAWAVSNSTVQRVDNSTVVFHLLHPYAAFLALLASPVASVVSEVCVNGHGGVQWGVRSIYLDHRVDCGSGPFMLSPWHAKGLADLTQVVNLTRFDQYWRGAAKLREVDILPVRDVLAREFMLLAGDADSAAIDRAHQWDVMNPDGTPKSPSLRIVKDRPAFTMSFFGLNRLINATAAPDPITLPTTFFANVHVRRAFAYSFDYNDFILNVTQDNGIQPRGPIPQGLPGYNASIPLVPFDMSKAAAELRNTSYWTSGFNLTLYYRAGNEYEQAGSTLLAAGLVALHTLKGSPGAIAVQTRALDSQTYGAALHAGGLPFALLTWLPRFADASDSVVPYLRTGSAFPGWIAFSNTTLDGLIDAAGAELNETVRVREYADLSADAALNDVPYIWVFQATSFHVERAWVRGYYFNPMLLGLDYYPLSKA
jgi:peptide/nickel transport system substrate-binding protein